MNGAGNRVLRAGAGACLLCVLQACSDDAAGPAAGGASQAPAPVVLAAVTEREFTLPIEGLGSVRAMEAVLVTSRVSGRVEQIFFTEGARVREGQALVRLEDDEERAELAGAKASAEQAESRYRRMQELTAQGVVSRDQAEEQAQVAKNANARLQLAQTRLDQRTVRAPFTGVLGFRQVSPGALVQAGSPIVSLDAVDTLRMEFSVAETQIAHLAVGAPIEARAAAHPGRVFSGKIRTIGSRVDEASRAVPVQALIDNADGALKPGMLLAIAAQTQPRTARFVPEAAVAPESSLQFVWRVDATGVAQKVRVVLGARIPQWVEVVEGLAAGDRVVVEGHANLRPGRAVREIERAAAAAG